MKSTLWWVGLIFGTLSVVMLIKQGLDVGVSETLEVFLTYYRALFDALVGWSTPLLRDAIGALEEIIKRLSPGVAFSTEFPSWWREGTGMLLFIISAWVRAALAKAVRVRDAIEFILVCGSCGVGTYYLDQAQTVVEAFYFGVAGTFVQLLAKGALSFAGRNEDPEGMVGRELLIVTSGAATFLVANAGLRLAGL